VSFELGPGAYEIDCVYPEGSVFNLKPAENGMVEATTSIFSALLLASAWEKKV
jgi:hypothetical protein